MENATEALKMAFTIFVFVIALTISINIFSQLNEVSRIMLTKSDITNYYEYSISEEPNRIVGLETIIPTLYKYYKENYTVLFLKQTSNGYEPLPLYTTQTDPDLWGSGLKEDGTNEHVKNISKYYVSEETGTDMQYHMHIIDPVCTFDVDEETIRHEPWTGNGTDFKINLDKFLYGDIFYYPSGVKDEQGNIKNYDYSSREHLNNKNGFIGKYAKSKFKEVLGQYTYDLEVQDDENDDRITNESALLKNIKKRVIIYILQ